MIALQNTVFWITLVLAVAIVLGGVWALVDAAITYGGAQIVPPSPEPRDHIDEIIDQLDALGRARLEVASQVHTRKDRQ